MTLSELVADSFERFADRPAVLAGGTTLDYRGLAQRCYRRAAMFKDIGLIPGDRVAAGLPNGTLYLELYLTCALSGLVLVPLNLRQHARELTLILQDAEPRALAVLGAVRGDLETAREATASIEHVFCMEENLEAVGGRAGQSCHSLADSDPAQIYYTSGTTGRPKGVVLSHGNVSSHARAAVVEFGLTQQDVWGHFAPMFHLADAWACFAVTLAGGAHCFLPRFEPKLCFAAIAQHAVTMTNLVPTMLQRMVALKEPERFPVDSLRQLLSGGAAIAPELVRRVQDLFACEYVQTYGLTETSPFLCVSLLDEEIAQLDEEQQFFYRSRTGRPFGGVHLRVIGEDGKPVPEDGASVGEIQARGPWVFAGYWRQPQATAEAFDGDWFLTGDLATVEQRGFLNIVDRKKDIILTGGETVYSTEVENALYTHQGVVSAAAFPVEDKLWGEVVAAAVVRPRAENARVPAAPELFAHCRLFLAAYKVPRILYFVNELPLTGSGKVQKRLLRERCRDLAGERMS